MELQKKFQVFSKLLSNPSALSLDWKYWRFQTFQGFANSFETLQLWAQTENIDNFIVNKLDYSE